MAGDRLESIRYDGITEERLDKFLVSRFPEFSRSRLQGLIKDGFVSIEGIPAEKAGQLIGPGKVVEVRIPPTQTVGLIPENIPLQIVFEDKDIIVINKPAGMVVHPSAGHVTGTLVNAALAHAPEMEGINGEMRPGVVHRLDKDTSGLILMAKNDHAQRWLQDQFRQRKVRKTYLALVDGHPPTPQGRIEAPIGRDPAHRKQMAIVPAGKGREASSEYQTIETFPRHTLLEVHPITGRTHQIRLHLAFIGCPIVGDTLYGYRRPTLNVTRQFLHSGRLEIALPRKREPIRFDAPLPADLVSILSDLRR